VLGLLVLELEVLLVSEESRIEGQKVDEEGNDDHWETSEHRKDEIHQPLEFVGLMFVFNGDVG